MRNYKSNKTQTERIIIKQIVNPKYNRIIEINPINRNHHSFKKILMNLEMINRDITWLLNQVQIKDECWRLYLRGEYSLPLNLIVEISEVFRKYNNRFRTPKHLIDYNNICLRYYPNVRNNLRHLMNKYNITIGQLINHTKIDKGNISLLLRNISLNPRHETLNSLYLCLKEHGVPLQSPLDLIYFPDWGEKEDTFMLFNKSLGTTKVRRIPNTQFKVLR